MVVTDILSSDNNGSALLGNHTPELYPWQGQWVCASPHIASQLHEGGCTEHFLKPFLTNWTVAYEGGAPGHVNNSLVAPALYCLSEGVNPANDKCGLQFNHKIMLVVCVLNAIKCLSICWTAHFDRNARAFSTIGDAIASFLESPDRTTKAMSLKSKQEYTHDFPWNSQPKTWEPRRVRWYRAAGRRRWLIVLTLYVVSIRWVAEC